MSLYASIRVGFHAKASAEAAVEPARVGSIAMNIIREDLQGALPPNGVLAGSFIGTDTKDDRNNDGDDLSFFSTADAPQHVDGNGEIKNIELTTVALTNSTDHVLIRRVTRNLLSQVQANPDEEIICRHVLAFNLQYYDGTAWYDSWDSTTQNNQLPAAVEVTLDLEPFNQNDAPHRYQRIFTLPCSPLSADNPSTTGGGL